MHHLSGKEVIRMSDRRRIFLALVAIALAFTVPASAGEGHSCLIKAKKSKAAKHTERSPNSMAVLCLEI